MSVLNHEGEVTHELGFLGVSGIHLRDLFTELVIQPKRFVYRVLSFSPRDLFIELVIQSKHLGLTGVRGWTHQRPDVN